MTKSQIACFLEVAKHGSFSKAADQLFISQPAVSKQVAQLEKEFGLTLFDRTHGSIQLTTSGKLFFDYFVQTEQEFRSVIERAQQMQSVNTGTIRLGCLDGWDVSAFYPQMNEFFQRKYPNLRLYLDGYNHGEVLNALRRGEIDVAITLDIAAQNQQDLSLRSITPTRAILLMSTQHPAAGREVLRLEDFKDDTFFVIMPPQDANPAMAEFTRKLCSEAGFTPAIEYSPSSAAVLMRLQSGMGVTITTEWTSACRTSLYRAHPLGPQLNVCVVWLNNGQNPAKNMFVNELLFFYRQNNL